ncbi:ATP-dependent RNA helicase DeaD [Methanocorpusculaceae archaeon Sp1]|uniref:RNA helicase n=1 Tax=Methanorbis furvi TaxID=3028299 RepID=A0AAE4MDF1_9EURY|nr:ATP-dependent RNA helicase DeaD [Methanocorpusculaceae archaeon Sp1]MDV0441478.1 ATP-dependent RNA helicase DeaD [Methanocorpusculaceae archaeon Ag1]
MEDTKTFAEFTISGELLQAIEDMGFEEPTPIQAMAIPQILEGNDVTGQAQTGTGKTAAFGIPIIERLDPANKRVQALVLSPTRELAIQTAEEFSRLMKYKQGLSVVPIYGGQPIERQLKVLRGSVQVVIGTPGRVIDHLKRGTLNLGSVKMFVLDEADQMLDMGFREDIEEIFHNTPEDRQTILFSATMPAPILDITRRFQRDPQFVKITRRELTVPQIEQTYIEIRERDKLEALSRLLDMNNPELALVFCNTKRTVDDLMSRLQARGYFVEALHGDMKQMQRDRVMARFRAGSIDVLIATDVAARGIDVDDVDMVFNYDVPQDVEYYVHRIGRTGRAGRAGKSVTFVSPREIYKLRDIQRYAKITIAKTPLPSLDDVAEMKMQVFLDKVRTVITAGNLEKYLPMVEQLLETEDEAEITSIEVAAALLKMHLDTGKNGSSESGETTSYAAAPAGEPGSFENTGAEAGMVRFRITLGKNQQIRPKDIVGAFAGECNIPGSCIGRIDLYGNYSFVEVPLEHAATVLNTMSQKTIRGQELEIQTATPRSEREEEEKERSRSFRSNDHGGDRRSSGGSNSRGGYGNRNGGGGNYRSGGDRRSSGGSGGGYGNRNGGGYDRRGPRNGDRNGGSDRKFYSGSDY